MHFFDKKKKSICIYILSAMKAVPKLLGKADCKNICHFNAYQTLQPITWLAIIKPVMMVTVTAIKVTVVTVIIM